MHRRLLARLIRVEEHPLGPRVYVAGQRVHEVALGIFLLAGEAAGFALHVLRPGDAMLAVGAIGLWLVIKDWRDLFPRWRNTQAHRRFGLHLPAGRGQRPRPGLPAIAAAGTLAVAAVNAASAATPNLAWRGHLLLQVEPVVLLPVFHAVAMPASVALGLTAASLYRRRRRALHVAVAMLVLLAVANLLKGFDVEEACVSLGLAGALWYGRATFDVGHAPLRPRDLLPVYLGGLAVTAAAAASVFVVGRTDPSIELAGRELVALLTWRPPPLPLLDGASVAVRALTLLALLTAASAYFRPRRPVRSPGPDDRSLVLRLVRAHGRDTLAAFKLRSDLEYVFSPDRRAFVGYRIERGVLLVAGDPVGEPASVDAAVDATLALAAAHGLRVGVVGASGALAARWRERGLRSLYIGDEAVVETASFTLEGRHVRKIRQSVSRLDAAGYTAVAEPVDELDEATRGELEEVSRRWRRGEPERGFAMSVDLLQHGLVVVARDAAGEARGFIHFLPTYGRAAMSLALMRRDPETPNGLMEFLVVRALEALRERGIADVSLNFAAFARSLREPRGVLDRIAGRLLVVASRWFQIDGLYRFNAKFFPRWEPRYLVYPHPVALPAVGVAVLAAEGQLPRRVEALLGAGASAPA